MFQSDGPRGPNIGDTIQNIGGASGKFRKIFRGGFRGILIIAFLILGGLWLSTGVYTVEAGEQAVVRQFGKFHSLAEPGLNFRIPAPVQTITKVNVEAIRTTQIGFRSQDGQTLRVLDEALMLTTDNSIVEAQLVVQYKVSDPKDFVFNVLEPEEGIIGIGSGGNYALAAAKVLMDSKMSAEEIAKKSIQVASEICVFTNQNITIEKI